MTISLLGSLTSGLLGWLMGFLSLFLIMLVLVQRGRGGGLSGALGGPGGQSAFGSKAGDTFTVITVVMASVWGFTCAFTMWLLGTHAPPTAITDTNVSAGPDEAGEVTDTSFLPDSGIGSPGGFGMEGLSSGDGDAETTELTPAESSTDTETEATESGDSDSPEAEGTETETTDAAPSDSEETSTSE